MDEHMTTPEHEAEAVATGAAETPQAPPQPPAPPPTVPFGAELVDAPLPDDRDKLVSDLNAHRQRLADLAEEDDPDAEAEQDAAKQAAGLASTGIPEPFARGQWVHRDADGNALATLVNFVCTRTNCHYATLDRRHAWMHAASHISAGR